MTASGDHGPPRRGIHERLRDIESVTDAALSRLDDQALLRELLERVKNALQADTAAVLLLDVPAGQLVATAASGIEEEVSQGVRIPLGAGFAGRVAASREPLILTIVDHTTVRNPLLVDRGIKSLLGVPLLAGGQVIGVLHVGSLRPRQFGPSDVELLQMAADRAALALRSLLSQDDAAVALQRSLLPGSLPAVPGVGLAARYVAGSGTVGGDWHDVFALPDSRIGVVIGDVAGSGLGAAVVMGRIRSALRAYVLDSADPAAVLEKLDRTIQYFEPDAMATVFYGLYMPETGQFTASSAGHLPPMLAVPDGSAGPIPVRPDPPIGTADDPARRSATVVIPPGGLLCCYTDGLVERRGQAIDRSMERLADTLAALAAAGSGDAGGRAAEDACAGVMRALVGNAASHDDIAVLMLSRPRGLPPP